MLQLCSSWCLEDGVASGSPTSLIRFRLAVAGAWQALAVLLYAPRPLAPRLILLPLFFFVILANTLIV